MIDTPQITRATAERAAVIHLTIPREQIAQVMGPVQQALLATVTAQGIAATGPWFSHHYRMDPATFDFDVGVPVASPVSPAGEVRPGELPGGEIVRTIFHGNYDGLAAAWGELTAWMSQQGMKPGPEFWERYLTGPSSSPDPAMWQTELNMQFSY